jgi:hypothetical protein
VDPTAAAHNVRFHDTGIKGFHHPVVGEITLTYNRMELAADPGLAITIYTAETRIGHQHRSGRVRLARFSVVAALFRFGRRTGVGTWTCPRWRVAILNQHSQRWGSRERRLGAVAHWLDPVAGSAQIDQFG